MKQPAPLISCSLLLLAALSLLFRSTAACTCSLYTATAQEPRSADINLPLAPCGGVQPLNGAVVERRFCPGTDPDPGLTPSSAVGPCPFSRQPSIPVFVYRVQQPAAAIWVWSFTRSSMCGLGPNIAPRYYRMTQSTPFGRDAYTVLGNLPVFMATHCDVLWYRSCVASKTKGPTTTTTTTAPPPGATSTTTTATATASTTAATTTTLDLPILPPPNIPVLPGSAVVLPPPPGVPILPGA